MKLWMYFALLTALYLKSPSSGSDKFFGRLAAVLAIIFAFKGM